MGPGIRRERMSGTNRSGSGSGIRDSSLRMLFESRITESAIRPSVPYVQLRLFAVLLLAVNATSVLKAAAVRPCRPMSFPCRPAPSVNE